MTNRQATGTKQDADRIVLSVPEAAQRLGVTPDAVRARLHRGTLTGEKQGGEWKVFLPGNDATMVASTNDQQDVTGKPSDETGPRQDDDRQTVAALIAAKDQTIDHLQDEITFLRDQLDKRSQELADERERSDVLHREAFARIEAARIVSDVTNGNYDQAPDPQDAPPDEPGSASQSPQRRDVAPSATEAETLGNESNTAAANARRSGFTGWWDRLMGR